jgi:genetic interactor of prohibitins 3, mitochondrial
MHRVLSARWINRALSIGEASASSSVPLFLCPAVGASSRFHRTPKATPLRTPLYTRRLNHTEATTTQDAPTTTTENSSPSGLEVPKRRLPLNCTGCGAFTQTSDPQMLGYFDPESKRVKRWLNPKAFERQHTASQEDGVVDDVLKSLDPSQLEALGLDPSLLVTGAEKEGHIAPSMSLTLLLQTIYKLTF